RVASLFACEVEGMPVPLGFSLHSLVRGLVVAYSLVGPEVSAVDMAPGRPPTLEGALGGTAASKGSSASGSGAAATASGTSGSSASNTGVPALDFGSDLELCKRKRLRLCIANHSAITTKYEVVIKAFAAKTVPRSLTTPDDENNSPTSPGKSSKSISHAGQTVAKLGSAHEEWSVYASKSGRKYIEAKVQAFEDREVLSAGRGVAFLALPKTGMLRPWQAVIIDVYCFNNMPGRYRSELHCLVDGLNPSVAPIKASVQGSPLCLASNTVGLVKRQGESRLHFGHPLVGTEPVYKVIKVSNNGPVAAKVSWRVVAKRGPKADLLETSIAFDEHKMAEDIDARVHVKLRPHADLSKAPPFVVEPHTLQIRPYASGSFRVTFFPDSAEEAEVAAIMIADADWVDEAHLKSVDDDGAAVSILTLDNLATELLASSIGTLREVVPPEVLAQGQEAGLPPGATLALTLRFQPAELVSKLAHDPNDVLRTTYLGALDIYFHNGEHQGIDLEGTVVSPAVLLAPAVFDFGHVHVETTTRTVLYMTNPTVVPASWRVSHVPKKARAGISSPNNPETIDDPSCWSFDIESGVLAGPTLPLSSAQGCMPKGFDSKGKRVPLAISLCFSPSRQGFHETKFRFAVDAGLDFDIVVRGTGSYEECHDTSVRPLPAPSF
ncbi:Deleted in lung and esophageal cancer protein 1, partial [Hondaea fermentalgiana]